MIHFLFLIFFSLPSSYNLSVEKITFKKVLKELKDKKISVILPDSTCKEVLKGSSIKFEKKGLILSCKVKNGHFYVQSLQKGDNFKIVKRIPNFLSLFPLLGVLFAALILRKTVLALLLGVFVGAVVAFEGGVWDFFNVFFNKYLFSVVKDETTILILVFTVTLIGMTGIMVKSGGISALIQKISKIAKTRKSIQMSAFLSGILIFFDDYANSVIVGSSYRNVFDKFKISREKLAYIVDSTAAPVAGLFFISTWIGYEISTLNASLSYFHDVAKNGYELFFMMIPFRFYCMFSLILLFLSILTGRDFFPMFVFEKKALQKEWEPDSRISLNEENASGKSILNGFLPVVLVLVSVFVGFAVLGGNLKESRGIIDFFKKAFINGASYNVRILAAASFVGLLTAIFIAKIQRTMSFFESFKTFFKSVFKIKEAIFILVLAISFRIAVEDLGTSDYIIGSIGLISRSYFPVVLFLTASVTSFATGSSWGTMGILIPLASPMIYELYSGSPDAAMLIPLSYATILDGAIFGDHCSPISDTTILSSASSGSKHLNHVITQIPYAVLSMLFALLFGYVSNITLKTGTFFSIILAVIFFVIFLMLFGRGVNGKHNKLPSGHGSGKKRE